MASALSNSFTIGFFIVTSLLVQISSRLSTNSHNYAQSNVDPKTGSKAVNYRQVEKNILDKILSPTIYDSQIR